MKPLEPEVAMSERVAARIRLAILNGSLAPSLRIRQEELAGRLGVSRAPIRQAMILLEREGLVHSTPNRGAIVAPLDRALIDDIYELRESIEGYVAGRAAARKDFDPASLRATVELGRRAAEAGDLSRLIDLDLAFHNGLYQAAGNRVIIEVMRTQWSHIRRAMRTTLTMSSYRKQFWDEHAGILEAVARRRASRARSLATAHIKGARELLASILP